MWKKIKTELFYTRKMLAQRRGPVQFFNYVKNKYFGLRMLKNMPKWDVKAVDDFEIHALSQKSMLWPLAWGLISFMYFSGLRPRIVVHGDGSIDENTARLFESKFSNVKVLRKEEADKLISKLDDVDERIKKYRNGKNKIILKFIDPFFLGKAKSIMIFDNDILFFRKPSEIIDFIKNDTSHVAMISKGRDYPLSISDRYAEKYDLYRWDAHKMNSGLILMRKNMFDLDKFTEYFDNTLEPEGYFIEMAGWSSLIVQNNFVFLPIDKYIIKGGIKESTVIKHFTSPRRHEMYAYGIDKAREMCKF